MSNIIWHNGELKDGSDNHIHHTDCGFTNSIGIFDSLLCIGSDIQYGSDHLERLHHDCKTIIGVEPNTLSYDKFEEAIHSLLKENSLQTGNARIRTTITGGQVSGPLAPAKTLNILISAGTAKPIEIKTATIIADFPRIAGCILENCKRLDYSRSYAARRMAKEQGADEAIITNTNGNIACGATSNLFIEEQGELITPPLSEGVLAGITRKNLIKEKNAKEEIISIDRLKQADHIYLSNSFLGLTSIRII